MFEQTLAVAQDLVATPVPFAEACASLANHPVTREALKSNVLPAAVHPDVIVPLFIMAALAENPSDRLNHLLSLQINEPLNLQELSFVFDRAKSRIAAAA